MGVGRVRVQLLRDRREVPTQKRGQAVRGQEATGGCGRHTRQFCDTLGHGPWHNRQNRPHGEGWECGDADRVQARKDAGHAGKVAREQHGASVPAGTAAACQRIRVRRRNNILSTHPNTLQYITIDARYANPR